MRLIITQLRLGLEQLILDGLAAVKAFILVFIDALDAIIDLGRKILADDLAKMFLVYFILFLVILFV